MQACLRFGIPKDVWEYRFTVEAWDVNCPQHIHRRWAERQITPLVEALHARIADLEARLARALDTGQAAS